MARRAGDMFDLEIKRSGDLVLVVLEFVHAFPNFPFEGVVWQESDSDTGAVLGAFQKMTDLIQEKVRLKETLEAKAEKKKKTANG